MAYFGQDFIDEVLDRNDIVDVISSYVSLKKKGNSFLGAVSIPRRKKHPSFFSQSNSAVFPLFLAVMQAAM